MRKYKVNADIEQLNSIGIDNDISNKIGDDIAIYGNWVVIDIDSVQYDLPKRWVSLI